MILNLNQTHASYRAGICRLQSLPSRYFYFSLTLAVIFLEMKQAPEHGPSDGLSETALSVCSLPVKLTQTDEYRPVD